MNRMREHFATSSPNRGQPDAGTDASPVRPASHEAIVDRLREHARSASGEGRPSLGKPVTFHTIPRNGRGGHVEDSPGRPGPPADLRHAGKPIVGPPRPGPSVAIQHGPIRHEQFRERLDHGHFDAITRSAIGRKLDFDRQYRHYDHGDVARRLDLQRHLQHHGGWRQHHHFGRISNVYLNFHFGHHYCGPRWYPNRVWWPHWSSWVNWSWWDYCSPIYDPRPVYCRPIVYASCPRVVVYDYPRWEPLPVVGCGTWVDVPPVEVAAPQYDVGLLAVRFVDAGHPENQLGPRFRVWVRNSSSQDLHTPFNVSIVAANDDRLGSDLPQAGVRIESIAAGETQSVDLRLPWEVYELGRDAGGKPVPFAKLHVIVDSHRELVETSESNNGAILERGEILPVDPAAFSTDVDTVVIGESVSIAGEGFGPEPGQVLLFVKGLELEPEIQGWYDLGVRVKIPALPLAELTEARLVVVRGDSAAANPLDITLAPAGIELLPAP